VCGAVALPERMEDGNMPQRTDDPAKAGLSRRGFLKGMGITTAAAGLLPGLGGDEAAAEENDASLRGPQEAPLSLKINGEIRELKVEPRVTLLDALRNRLDLTGSKKVCDRGTCGACTVLVDGAPAYACSMLAVEAEGRDIVTIEGLGTPDNMTPLQASFQDHDAQQCGFCTPGFIVAGTAFLRDHPNPTPEEVRAGMGGNLCRCGTYAGIEKALLAAAAKGGA